MVEYSKVNTNLSDAKVKQLKIVVKNKTATTLRMSLKMFDVLLKTRQKAKLRNAFNNNISTDLKLSKAQSSKIIQSGGFLGSLLNKLAGPLMKVMKVAAPLAKKYFNSIRNNNTCFSN